MVAVTSIVAVPPADSETSGGTESATPCGAMPTRCTATVQSPSPPPRSRTSTGRVVVVPSASVPNPSEGGSASIPGSTAAATFTRPAPAASGEASRVPASSTNAGLAVAISAPLTSAGVQSGCACRSSAAAPATTGVDIDVPSYTAQSPATSFVESGIDERMPTPGAARSGFRRWSNGVGPADENVATTPGTAGSCSVTGCTVRRAAEPDAR